MHSNNGSLPRWTFRMNMDFCFWLFTPFLFSIYQRMFYFSYFEGDLFSLINQIVFRCNISPFSKISIELWFLDYFPISDWTSRFEGRCNESIKYLGSLLGIDSDRRLVGSFVTHTWPSYLWNFSPIKFNIFTSFTRNLLWHSLSWIIDHIIGGNDLSL